jgi:phosphoribosylaminoimidazole-succinocarboxamide synthase
MARRRQIYEGKAKILYEGPEPGTIIQYFKDDATAFNAQKRGTISGKGVLNNRISEHVFTLLAHIGVPTHFIRRLNMREQLVRQVEIVPIEVVVRNVVAGSLSKRLGIEEGTQLPRTLIEYYYKDDALGDPLISEEHIACFGWASQEEMHDIADMAIRVNDFMSGMFAGIGIRLVDFKLEFGRIWDGDFSRILLADAWACCPRGWTPRFSTSKSIAASAASKGAASAASETGGGRSCDRPSLRLRAGQPTLLYGKTADEGADIRDVEAWRARPAGQGDPSCAVWPRLCGRERRSRR